ncbi:uncharacterized protein ACR2FA_002090 [Aphomia sociella]
MWKLIATFGALVTVVHGQSTPVESCASNTGVLPINTFIHGCGAPPCVFTQLEDAVLDIVFRAPKAINNMTTLATTYMDISWIIIPVPYDLQENLLTCNFVTNTNCPVREGEIVQYRLNMPISTDYTVNAVSPIEIRVVDESDQSPVFCLRTNHMIVTENSITDN